MIVKARRSMFCFCESFGNFDWVPEFVTSWLIIMIQQEGGLFFFLSNKYINKVYSNKIHYKSINHFQLWRNSTTLVLKALQVSWNFLNSTFMTNDQILVLVRRLESPIRAVGQDHKICLHNFLGWGGLNWCQRYSGDM